MSHAQTTTKNSKRGVPMPAPAATALLSHEASGTMFRRGFAAIALACCLMVATGDARARQVTPDEELAYCRRLHGLYLKYHVNYYVDGNWAEAELARHHCDHGKFEPGTTQLERILRGDLFVIPSERSPTYTGFAQH